MFLRRESVPDLLNVLDAAVIRGGAAGFEGRVAFGVEISPDRALWWVAELGAAPTTSFTTELPFDADAGAIMGLNEADALLGRGERQTDHFATFGSVELLQRTMERYLKHRSPIDARASGSAPPTRRRKNGRSAR